MQNISPLWLTPLILFAGALQAWGPPMNGALRGALENPWLASVVTFLPVLASYPAWATAMMSACIIAAQLIMLPVALAVGVQLLDGIGAGIFGAITPLVIADLMRGTGCYKLAQGAVATAQGLGASLSGLVAGMIVDHFGYAAGFLTFGAAACAALAVLFLAMPETAPKHDPKAVRS